MIQLHTPIFLNVEYSLSFVREYPVCATAKNIVMPYPTTDPDFFSGRLYLPHYRQQLLDKQSDADKSALQPRDKLVFYHGGNHGSCVFIRSALNEIMRNKQIATQRGDRKREMGFQSAVFCPIPVGDSPGSKRMYDVLNVRSKLCPAGPKQTNSIDSTIIVTSIRLLIDHTSFL